MGRKLLAGLQWMVSLAAVFAAGAVYVTNSRILGELESARTEDQRSTASLAHEIQELRKQVAVAQNQANGPPAAGQPGATDGPPGEPGDAEAAAVPLDSAAKKPSLTVQLVYDREGRPPVEEPVKEMKLIGGGRVYEGGVAPGGGMPGEPGRYLFTVPGGERYRLIITLADGQTSERNILVRDDLPRQMTVVCPEPRTKVAVAIMRSPLPEDLQDVCGVDIRMEQQPALVVEGAEWRMPRLQDQHVEFNNAGKITYLSFLENGTDKVAASGLDLHAASDDDRRIVLMDGPVDLQWTPFFWGEGGVNTKFTDVIPRPEPFRRTVKQGEDHWELEIPEELIADMRKVLAAAKKAGD